MKTANLAIVFIDIVGFTERTGRQSRAESEAWLRRYELMILPLVRALGGRKVKSIGDAYLCTFPSPTNALLFGMAAQDRLYSYNLEVPEQEHLRVRVAINAGEVRLRSRDVFGEPVNIAARVEGQIPPGEIWFTEAVYLSMTKSEVPAEELGLRSLKGVAEPVRLYRVPADHAYRLAPQDGAAGSQAIGGDAGPEVERFPYGGLGLRRAEQAGWGATLGAVPERLVQAGQGLLEGLGRRLAAIPRRVWIGTIAVLAGIGLISALVSAGPFAECLEALEAGQVTRAQQLLDSHAQRREPSGRAIQARIWLRREAPEISQAAAALLEAIEQDPSLTSDPEVLRDLVSSLDQSQAKATIDLLIQRLGDRAIDPLLGATTDRRYWLRWNSVKALQGLGQADRVDLVLVYIQDLLFTGRCSTRKQAAAKLAEFRDPRALEPLRRAQNRNFLENLCMGDTLSWAIAKIEKG